MPEGATATHRRPHQSVHPGRSAVNRFQWYCERVRAYSDWNHDRVEVRPPGAVHGSATGTLPPGEKAATRRNVPLKTRAAVARTRHACRPIRRRTNARPIRTVRRR